MRVAALGGHGGRGPTLDCDCDGDKASVVGFGAIRALVSSFIALGESINQPNQKANIKFSYFETFSLFFLLLLLFLLFTNIRPSAN